MVAPPRFSVYPSKFADFTLVDGVFKATFEISNESNENLGFQILTNSQDDYVVMPKSGFIPKAERALCTVELKRDGNFHESHSFIINIHPSKGDEVDRVEFWNRLKDASVAQYKIGVKHPRLDEGRILERLVQQVHSLKSELRNARTQITEQNKLIGELREAMGVCHHPSSLTVFVIACIAIASFFGLVNYTMHGSLYKDAIRPLI